ncbi:pyridoxamine 5'-phosphate oxidase family protein [Halobellus sp. Atlit-31R]|nr:pyridoxamine 5'-phosphate oxidase family protein [Halobellus sp. Atlit-31R]
MHVTGAWSTDEAGEFLRTAQVPVRLACHTPKGHLWMLSLWYLWTGSGTPDTADADATPPGCRSDPPELCCATSASAAVVDYLRNDDAVAFEVSTNDPPYCGVRGRGTAQIEPDDDMTLLRALFDRYLGGTDNELADHLLGPERKEVRIRIAPDRLHSWDFSNRMQDVSTPTREE